MIDNQLKRLLKTFEYSSSAIENGHRLIDRNELISFIDKRLKETDTAKARIVHLEFKEKAQAGHISQLNCWLADSNDEVKELKLKVSKLEG